MFLVLHNFEALALHRKLIRNQLVRQAAYVAAEAVLLYIGREALAVLLLVGCRARLDGVHVLPAVCCVGICLVEMLFQKILQPFLVDFLLLWVVLLDFCAVVSDMAHRHLRGVLRGSLCALCEDVVIQARDIGFLRLVTRGTVLLAGRKTSQSPGARMGCVIVRLAAVLRRSQRVLHSLSIFRNWNALEVGILPLVDADILLHHLLRLLGSEEAGRREAGRHVLNIDFGQQVRFLINDLARNSIFPIIILIQNGIASKPVRLRSLIGPDVVLLIRIIIIIGRFCYPCILLILQYFGVDLLL